VLRFRIEFVREPTSDTRHRRPGNQRAGKRPCRSPSCSVGAAHEDEGRESVAKKRLYIAPCGSAWARVGNRRKMREPCRSSLAKFCLCSGPVPKAKNGKRPFTRREALLDVTLFTSCPANERTCARPD
jgi:hypothetical protein